MISRDRHRIAPHKTDLTCMANGIPFFGTVHVSKFQIVWVDQTLPVPCCSVIDEHYESIMWEEQKCDNLYLPW